MATRYDVPARWRLASTPRVLGAGRLEINGVNLPQDDLSPDGGLLVSMAIDLPSTLQTALYYSKLLLNWTDRLRQKKLIISTLWVRTQERNFQTYTSWKAMY
jgi:hypothetical protein